MHDHHGGGVDGSMFVDLLPLWLQVLWALVMGAVLAHHLIACGYGRRVDRAERGAHAILATGMLYMFLPWPHAPLPPAVMVTAFCGMLVVTLTVLAAGWVVTGSLRRPRLLLATDCAAMAYMSQMTGSGFGPITYTLVVYYGASAVVWMRSTSLPAGARAGHAAMAAAMAYMFFAMGSATTSLMDRAGTSNALGYAVAGCLLISGVLIACAPRHQRYLMINQISSR